MSTCTIYTLGVSTCSCQLVLLEGTKETAINLFGAQVWHTPDTTGNFVIQGIKSGARVSAASGFTLADIELLICSCHASGGGGGGGGTGDASALNQTQMINRLTEIRDELQDDNLLQENVVLDDVDVVHVRRTTVNSDDGTVTTTYINPQSGAVTTPTFPLKIGSGLDHWELYVVDDLFDDVAGDQSGDIIPIRELKRIDNDGTETSIRFINNKGNPYTVLGTVRSLPEIEPPTKTTQRRLILSGNTWSPTVLTQSYSIFIINVNSPGNPPTYTDNNAVTTPLFEGGGFSITQIEGTQQLDNTNISVVAQVGDIVEIVYTQIDVI